MTKYFFWVESSLTAVVLPIGLLISAAIFAQSFDAGNATLLTAGFVPLYGVAGAFMLVLSTLLYSKVRHGAIFRISNSWLKIACCYSCDDGFDSWESWLNFSRVAKMLCIVGALVLTQLRLTGVLQCGWATTFLPLWIALGITFLQPILAIGPGVICFLIIGLGPLVTFFILLTVRLNGGHDSISLAKVFIPFFIVQVAIFCFEVVFLVGSGCKPKFGDRHQDNENTCFNLLVNISLILSISMMILFQALLSAWDNGSIQLSMITIVTPLLIGLALWAVMGAAMLVWGPSGWVRPAHLDADRADQVLVEAGHA